MSQRRFPATSMARRTLWPLALVLWLVACTVSAPPPGNSPAPVSGAAAATLTSTPDARNRLGIHLLLDDGRKRWPPERWPEHLQYARELVGEWGYVVELVRLDDLDPRRWQPFFDECARLHLIPLLRLATTFDRERGWWNAPPADADGAYATVARRYADFIIALKWPTTTHYMIVGNEPNHGDEWGGRASPSEYARFLRDVSQALHAADREAKVLNAPLDPFAPNTNGQPFVNGMSYLDAESFLDGMHRSDPAVFSAIDVWASHAYPLGPLSAGPWEQAFQIDWLNGAANPDHRDPPPGIFNRGVNGYEWELFKLATYGVPELPVMITETGWRHAETSDPTAADNGREWPTTALVAEYADLAWYGNQGRYPAWPEEGWKAWRSDPRVMAVVFFALDGDPAEWGHTNWLQLDAQGRVLGVYAMYDKVQELGKVYR